MLKILVALLLLKESEQRKCKSISRRYFCRKKPLKSTRSRNQQIDLTENDQFLFLTESRWGREVLFDSEDKCSKSSYGIGTRLFLRKRCNAHFCSLYHGFKGDNFLSPTILLTSQNRIHIQITAKSGVNYAVEVF